MADRAGKDKGVKNPTGFEKPNESTIGLRETFLGKVLPPDEYAEACRNLGAFFEILYEWSLMEGDNGKD